MAKMFCLIPVTLFVCVTALLINHENCALKYFELETQLEVARALSHYVKPSVEVTPRNEGPKL